MIIIKELSKECKIKRLELYRNKVNKKYSINLKCGGKVVKATLKVDRKREDGPT